MDTTYNESKYCKKKFKIKKKNFNLIIEHLKYTWMIKATGYLFDKIAYISDCNKLVKKFQKINKFRFFIIDCLRRNKHPSHFNYDEL
jgi:hypothetical protein